jgi:hypothetical protein
LYRGGVMGFGNTFADQVLSNGLVQFEQVIPAMI